MSQTVNNTLNQMRGRAFNFSAGPTAIPEEVLIQVYDELLNWNNVGASVMEISHRGKEFTRLVKESEQDLRELMAIPDNYHVLFLQGGARGQFSAVPMNLKKNKTGADYVNSGFWAQAAINEAKRHLDVSVVAECIDGACAKMPEQSEWVLSPDAAFLHYTPNETIGGLEFPYIPESGDVPLVADMSSNILSRPIDVSRFGIIYAGAQKNIGTSGLTVVIIRSDLLDRAISTCPSVLNYTVQYAKNSMFCTPPVFSWYIASLVFKWLKAQGGVVAINKVNERKAKKLYDIIDNTGFYTNLVDEKWRSKMNVPFTLRCCELDSIFCNEAEKEGFLYLKGHKAVGGVRASIYNAIPESHVDTLIGFMKEFERRYG